MKLRSGEEVSHYTGTPENPWRPDNLKSSGWATKGSAWSLCGQYYYDAAKADRVIRWIEAHCVHTKGNLAGHPVRMMRHHRRIIRKIFGWIIAKGPGEGTRKHKTFFHAIPRGNAKTTLLAWIALYLLIGDGEHAAHIYSIGSDESEARIMFNEAVRIAELSPPLQGHLETLKSALYFGETNSAFLPLPDKKKGHHGLTPYAVLGDEVHVWTNRNQYEAARSARSKRPNCFQGFITTAGNDRNSLCWELWQKGINVNEARKLAYDENGKIVLANQASTDQGKLTDLPDWLVSIFAADEEDDWEDEDVWFRINPALADGVKSLATLRDEFKEALTSPQSEANFRQLHLNQWTEQNVRWLSQLQFDKLRTEISPVEAYERLIGCECVAGIDLASVLDLSSMLMIFDAPNGISDELPVFLWRHWIDRHSMKERFKRDKVDYPTWHKQGWLDTTPGKTTDFGHIRDCIVSINSQTPIKSLGYDPTFAADMVQRLQGEDGIECEKVQQSLFRLAQPSAEFERLITNKGFIHIGDPVTRWAIGNVAVYRAGDGKFKPDKAVSTERIDPISAAVTAMARYLDTGEFKPQSVYESRAPLVFD